MKKHDFYFWCFLCLLAGVLSIFYVSAGMAAGGGKLLMPLDDAYIHFQYARQMATGSPYQYNNGDEPASGATSFLYTPLLAIGYFIGFKGLSLAYPAVGIGAVCWLLSAWLIYKILPAQRLAAYLIPVLFLLTGAFSWAAFSGMETSLFVLATLFALYAYQKQRYIGVAGVFVALVRPEGALIVLPLILATFWRSRKPASVYRERFFQVALPVLAIFVQPAVNWIVTGTPSATGNQAKSHLYNVTQPLASRLAEIGETWIEIWWEMLTGYSRVDGWYLFPLFGLLAVGMVLLSVRFQIQAYQGGRRTRISMSLPAEIHGASLTSAPTPGVRPCIGHLSESFGQAIYPGMVVGAWLILLSGAIATLDTANWHFKRYQLPMYALLFPLVGWLVAMIPRTQKTRILAWGISASALLFSVWTTIQFASYYETNIRVVKNQQLAMAEWVNENLPADARIAVHDVGVMRYVGNRYTWDVVGLTTEGNAAAWRQGPGTLYENLAHAQPDYFAIYPDVLGLPFLVEAGVYGEALARFEMQLPSHTAASATGTQVVTRAKWSGVEAAQQPYQINADNLRLIAVLNVADLASEAKFNYAWHNSEAVEEFATMVRNMPYFACETCMVIDGGRVITGGEQFNLPNGHEKYLVLARVEAASSAILKVGCDEIQDTGVVPALPGQWVEIPFLVEGDTFCLETDGTYYSYRYWIYTVESPDFEPNQEFLAEFADPFAPDFKFQLTDVQIEPTENALQFQIEWQTNGSMTHDGRFFVHLYTDPSQPPVAQMDVYLNDSPPANWLPGVYQESLSLPIASLPAGEYSLAIGFYDPVSGQRYQVGEDARLFLEWVVVE